MKTTFKGGVSLKRISDYLNAPEVDPHTITHEEAWDDPIVVRKVGNGN